VLTKCGLGGVDPDRALRPGHLDPEERQAHCALDVCDSSEANLTRCSVHCLNPKLNPKPLILDVCDSSEANLTRCSVHCLNPKLNPKPLIMYVCDSIKHTKVCKIRMYIYAYIHAYLLTYKRFLSDWGAEEEI
jgi:hypothetical protein